MFDTCSVGLLYLYAGPRVFSTKAAGQSPAAGRDVGHLGDGLHLLRTANAHLQGAERSTLRVLFNIEAMWTLM